MNKDDLLKSRSYRIMDAVVNDQMTVRIYWFQLLDSAPKT